VSNYFPAVVTEAEWYATRRAIERRRPQRGPCGKRVRSLFSGIIFDARDGCPMHVKTKGAGRRTPYLLSSGVMNRRHGGEILSIPYELVEEWFLRFLERDLVAELLRKEEGQHEEKIAGLAGELLELDRKIQDTKRKYEEEEGYAELLDLLKTLERKKRARSAELEKLRQEQTSNDTETLGEARSLLAMLQGCTPEELLDLRTRLKARVRALVESIWVLIEGGRPVKLATVQVFFHNGQSLRFTARHPDAVGSRYAVGGPTSSLKPADDLQQWRYLEEKPTFHPTIGQGGVWTKEGREWLEEQLRGGGSGEDPRDSS
jgi:hypothetical protein